MPSVSIISRIRRYSSHVFFAVLSFFFEGGEFRTGLKLVGELNRDIQESLAGMPRMLLGGENGTYAFGMHMRISGLKTLHNRLRRRLR